MEPQTDLHKTLTRRKFMCWLGMIMVSPFIPVIRIFRPNRTKLFLQWKTIDGIQHSRTLSV
ncbi:MAG: hypothetical protein N3A72_10305 [bacterium]|nr:hypothetical protein [bacterium]